MLLSLLLLMDDDDDIWNTKEARMNNKKQQKKRSKINWLVVLNGRLVSCNNSFRICVTKIIIKKKKNTTTHTPGFRMRDLISYTRIYITTNKTHYIYGKQRLKKTEELCFEMNHQVGHGVIYIDIENFSSNYHHHLIIIIRDNEQT